MSNNFSVVGNWRFGDKTSGISVFKYFEDTSAMTKIGSWFNDVLVGQQFYDKKRQLLYINNECDNNKGKKPSRYPSILLIKLDKDTGIPTIIDEKRSLAPNPSYIWLDKTGDFFLVSHHVTPAHITKIITDENGKPSYEFIYNDAPLVLYSVNEDGTLGEILDAYVTREDDGSGNHPVSHQHIVAAEPSGELFFVCDKGLDKVFTFTIDRKKGKLAFQSSFDDKFGSMPRYLTFHPTLPLAYVNHENQPYVSVLQYDIKSGELSEAQTIDLVKKDAYPKNIKLMSSDIKISPNGNNIYVTLRGANEIIVFSINEKGLLSFKQNISCGGLNPRGLCFSPDGKYLHSANVDSGDIVSFAVEADGTLSPTGLAEAASCPGNMQIVSM